VSTAIYLEFFGKCMVAPIKRCLNYNEIGKKLTVVSELPKCESVVFNLVARYSPNDITPQDVAESQAEIDDCNNNFGFVKEKI